MKTRHVSSVRWTGESQKCQICDYLAPREGDLKEHMFTVRVNLLTYQDSGAVPFSSLQSLPPPEKKGSFQHLPMSYNT